MESPSITLSSKITFWMQYRATRALINRLWTTYLMWGFFIGVPLLMLSLMLYLGMDIFALGALGLPRWMIPLASFLYIFALMPFIRLWNIYAMRRRNPSAGGVQTYTITLDGFAIHGSFFDATLKWEAFLKAVETKEFILLYISTRYAHLIPKVAASAPDLQAIRAIIREKLGAKAKLKTA